jgi:hypothetical protein
MRETQRAERAGGLGKIARRRAEEKGAEAFFLCEADEVGGFSMFAPPISQQNRASAASTSPSGELCAGGNGGTTFFRSVRSDEDGGNPANIAASGVSNQTGRDCASSSQSQTASMSTSISLTLPRAATTGLSTVLAPGARVRSVQLPSAAKKRK